MGKFLLSNTNQFLSYIKYNTIKKNIPYVVFHHGLMSSMNGSKSLYIQKYCKEKSYNYICFDNFGHGQSSGIFEEQTITSWLSGLNHIIELTGDNPVILIGSSMGAWITLLASMQYSQKIIGMIGISSAADFTENLIWDKLSIKEQNILQKNGIYNVRGNNPECSHTYPISYDLIKDGRKYLLLNKDEIKINHPVHLIHGMNDSDVPFSISQSLLNKITHNNVTLKLIKDGDHTLSRLSDLAIICHSIEEIMQSNI